MSDLLERLRSLSVSLLVERQVDDMVQEILEKQPKLF